MFGGQQPFKPVNMFCLTYLAAGQQPFEPVQFRLITNVDSILTLFSFPNTNFIHVVRIAFVCVCQPS